jgi:menaquinone-dependent protoporphyrinogen oxidase
VNILILYGTTEGQTEKIAQQMAKVMRNQGHEVTSQHGKALPDDAWLEAFDAVIVGGSIHMGRYQPYIKKFITTHRDWLNGMPSAFFSVCMAIHSQNAKSREEAKAYVSKLLHDTGWQPKLTHTFAGAVKYTQYNFITRFIMKMITKREGGSTDTSHDHEYTDWDDVKGFSHSFLEAIGS